MKTVKKSKRILIMVLLMIISMGGFQSVKAASNPDDAPPDWAFDSSSLFLNDFLVQVFEYNPPIIDPGINPSGTGFITISEANSWARGFSFQDYGLYGSIEGIEYFTSAERLSLAENDFTGEIPQNIGNLSNLKNLNLGFNQLSGEVPASIGNMTRLEFLGLASNNLSGTIPDNVTNLVNLEMLQLNHNQFIGMSQSVYDFISSGGDEFTVNGQRYTTNLTNKGVIKTDYEFNGLPAYEQFPTYESTFSFTYTLTSPDGTNKVIQPIVANGKVRIAGNDLTQIGSYVLSAYGDSTGYLKDMLYSTTFDIENDQIKYTSANANGKKEKETSSNIKINLSKDLTSGLLTLDDIGINSKTRATTIINKNTLTYLGNGQYEIGIDGTWNEGDAIDVILSKSDVAFTPDSHSTVLHKQKTTNGNIMPENPNNSNINTGTLPNTGSSSLAIGYILFGLGSLFIMGTIAYKKSIRLISKDLSTN